MRLSLLTVAVVAHGAAACSAPVASTGGDLSHDAAGLSSAAFVVVERTVAADGTTRGSVTARFIKMRSGLLDEPTLRMVGATLDLPETGTCRTSPLTGSVAASSSLEEGPGAVDLLDVGALTLEAGGEAGPRRTLEARALPDVVDLVSGVLYSARAGAADDEALPARGSYVLRSTGSSLDPERVVPPFSVAATAPGEPGELRIEGQDARAPYGVVVGPGAVTLDWELTADGDPEDLVYVDVLSAGGAGDRAPDVRCVFADRGVATVPASAFASAFVRSTDGTAGTLVVHRLHRETFQVPAGPGHVGIEAGAVRFDFARSTTITHL